MALAVWIRAALSRSDQWCVELERLRVALAAEPAGPQKIERTLDLAEATEHVEPDRTKALALYLAAWREGHVGARSSVLALARELRAYMTVAEIAIADHADTKDPESLVIAGRAYVDAGLFERATETFVNAAAQHPSLASALATAPRLVDVRVAVAKSRFQKVDPEREIDGCMARAQQSGEAAAFLQAARIARFSKLERYGMILGLAARQCPTDDEIARLFEDTLLESRSAEDFLVYHRRRLEAVQGEDAWVECVRAAACELVLRNIHPGLGLRMLRTSIEHAYNAKLTDGMRRHIAAWELLVTAAKSSHSTVALAPLVADGLRAPLAPDDAIYIARLGLEIAWRDGHDTVAAQPYAAALLDRVPGHPLAAAFLGELMPVPPVTTEPVLPTVTFRMPVIKRDVSPIPAPPTPPPDATTRAKRMVVPVDVVVELPAGGFFSAVLRDLSASGAFVTTKRALEVGTVVSLEIRLPSSRVLSEQNFRIDARIARRTELGCGLAFIAPPPELVAGITALIE